MCFGQPVQIRIGAPHNPRGLCVVEDPEQAGDDRLSVNEGRPVIARAVGGVRQMSSPFFSSR